MKSFIFFPHSKVDSCRIYLKFAVVHKSKLFKESSSSHGALIGPEIMEENETEAVPFESNGVTTEEIFSNSSKARVSQPGLGQLLTESSW